jgi:glycosyltransferase involved in cell wall biosynthesis
MNPFQFSPSELDSPRKPGISAIMRIKNGEDFLEASIESHLPFYDEIVACYNGCTDNTASILEKLARRHPEKIRVFHYEPDVAPP